MANIELKGKITSIFPVEKYGNFEKRVVWIKETEGQYPSTWAIEFQQGKVNEPDSFRDGDLVSCKIEIAGKHWEKNGKEGVINTLKCYGISRISGSKPSGNKSNYSNPNNARQQPTVQQEVYYPPTDEDLALPF